jgi:uncharacterized coiled-coil protein SlyX
MNVEERISRTERRIATVEDAIKLLSELLANHDDRLYDSLKSRENMNAKIIMLIDAQISSEDKLQKLTELVEAAHLRIDRLKG